MIVDSVGNEYIVGAIVRMDHFSTNKKKYYMYKQVVEINIEKGRVGFIHLGKISKKEGVNFSLSDRECQAMTVIVEAYYCDHREIKRNPKMRD